jgi:hypothetical protein
MRTEKPTQDALLKEYDNVTQQFRKLSEIRFQLLGLLPLGTAASAVFLQSNTGLAHQAAPIALFGFITTLALFVYSLRNDQHYDELVGRAAELERLLGLHEGSFVYRPGTWQQILPGVHVEHRWPITTIYVGSAALWLWIALTSVPGLMLPDSWALLCALAFAVALIWQLGRSRSASSTRYRHAVVAAMQLLVGARLGPGTDQLVLDTGRTLARHLGGGRSGGERFENRTRFYLKAEDAQDFVRTARDCALDLHSASQVLGQVIDMPARWVRDVHTGRRAS